MYLIFYLVFYIVRCLIQGKPFLKSEIVECYKEYKNCMADNKKSMSRVFGDVNMLVRYWKTFPDTYFIFCHFLKDYEGNAFLRSFLPQTSYGRACWGG